MSKSPKIIEEFLFLQQNKSMSDLISKIYDPSAFRQQGHQLIDLLADYLEKVQTRQEDIAIPYQTPDESLSFWLKELDAPLLNDPTAFFSEVLKRSTRLHHPHTMGHQVPPPAPAAALAGLMSNLLNNGMAVYEMGMVSNAMEKIVTDVLSKRIGYDEKANGILTSGGTLANLTALLTARATKTTVWTDGVGERLAVMVSDEAHYCIDRAARIMGLGSAGIIKIPTDKNYKMRTDLLEKHWEKAKKEGLTVFAIVGSCCSTSTGMHDDLEAIAAFAEKHNLWFHADAAHGGAAVFSQKYRPILRGVERADSVVVDFHKMLLTPALATALVFRRGADSFQTFQQKAQYLWENTQHDWYDSGKRTFECTKYMMSLKIFTLLRLYGETAFEQNVDVLYDMGKTFAAMILKRPHFELAVEPECNIVCFRLKNKKDVDLSDFNAKIRQKLIEKGHFYITQSNLRGETYLRVSLMNPLIRVEDLEDLLDEIER